MKKDTWFSRMWAQSTAFKIAVIGVPALLAFFVVRKIKEDKRKKGLRSDLRADADVLAADPNSGLGGVDPLQRILELKLIAENISKAFWSFQSYAWGTVILWRLTEDEELAIQELNKVRSALEAGFVSDYYADYNNQYSTATLTTGKKGMSLLADVNKFFNASEKSRVHSYCINALK